MSREEVEELVGEEGVFYADIDSAIIGVADRCGMPTVVCYDRNKAIEALKNTFSDVELDEDDIANDMTIEDKKYEMAVEWFEYNVIGGYLGENTPIFVTLSTD